MFSSTIKKHTPLFFIIFAYILLIYRYSGFVPLWDSFEYVNTHMYKAVISQFSLLNFNFAEHVSFAWTLLTSWPQYLSFGNMTLLHFTVAFFTVLSIISFYGILKHLFSGNKHNIEVNLLTFLYAFYPPFVANALQYSPDYGVLVFYTIFLYFLITKHKKLTILSGLCLVFTKETGIVLYIISIFILHLFTIFEQRLNRKNIQNFIWNFSAYILPFLFYVFFQFIKVLNFRQEVLPWYLDPMSGKLQMPLFPASVVQKIPFSYFLGIFVINFNWILSTFLIIGLVLSLFHFFSQNSMKSGKTWGINKSISYLYIVFLSATAIFSLYKIFTNLRYFLPLYVFMIILFYFGLKSVFRKRRIVIFILSIIVIVFFISCFRTVDPVSRKIYGTFKFGNHDILDMTSITGECCGYGRDQLVYNLEYTHLHYLLNDLLHNIRPPNEDAFAYNLHAGPFLFPVWDKSNFSRTVSHKNVHPVYIINWYSYLYNKPKIIYYIEMPNTDNTNYLQWYETRMYSPTLKLHYALVKEMSFDDDGYALKVYKLKYKSEIPTR